MKGAGINDTAWGVLISADAHVVSIQIKNICPTGAPVPRFLSSWPSPVLGRVLGLLSSSVAAVLRYLNKRSCIFLSDRPYPQILQDAIQVPLLLEIFL